MDEVDKVKIDFEAMSEKVIEDMKNIAADGSVESAERALEFARESMKQIVNGFTAELIDIKKRRSQDGHT